MSFIAPSFLYALFVLPIPFIIHLWHRHRLKKIWFPSISLITQAKQGERAFRRLKDILLLVLRTLILLFLVLAFSNPCLLRKQKVAILDDSYDMSTKLGNSTVFEKAENIAQRLNNTKILLASGKSYPSECKYQKFFLPTEGVDYIITIADKLSDTLKLKPKLIEIPADKDNFSVDSISFGSNSLLAFISNHTSAEKTRLITLAFDNQVSPVFETRLLIPPHSASTAIFPAVPVGSAGSVKVEEEDALLLDNIRYFVYSPPQPLKVLIVSNPEEAFFLKNSLSPEKGKSSISVEISPTIKSYSDYDVMAFLGSSFVDYRKAVLLPTETQEVNGFITLANLSETHPIFKDFGFIKELKGIKFTHRKNYTDSLSKTIASFSDGSPAIIEHNSGAIEFLFPLNINSKEFVLSPLFPPLMHRVFYWVAGKPIESYNFGVGEEVLFRVTEFKPYKCIMGTEESLLTPRIEPTGLYVYFIPEVPGIYDIPGVSKFAVNIKDTLIYPTLDIKTSIERVSIKRWLFLFVLLLLVAELIIRRVNL